MPLDAIKSAANDYSLNIRRYADNSPPPEPHDVRAHLHGGVPKTEIAAQADLFAAHGFDAVHLFAPRSPSLGGEGRGEGERSAFYLDFAPSVKSRPNLRAAIEAEAGVKAKEQALLDALNAWWKWHERTTKSRVKREPPSTGEEAERDSAISPLACLRPFLAEFGIPVQPAVHELFDPHFEKHQGIGRRDGAGRSRRVCDPRAGEIGGLQERALRPIQGVASRA